MKYRKSGYLKIVRAFLLINLLTYSNPNECLTLPVNTIRKKINIQKKNVTFFSIDGGRYRWGRTGDTDISMTNVSTCY